MTTDTKLQYDTEAAVNMVCLACAEGTHKAIRSLDDNGAAIWQHFEDTAIQAIERCKAGAFHEAEHQREIKAAKIAALLEQANRVIAKSVEKFLFSDDVLVGEPGPSDGSEIIKVTMPKAPEDTTEWVEPTVTEEIQSTKMFDCPHCGVPCEISKQMLGHMDEGTDWKTFGNTCPHCFKRWRAKVESRKFFIVKEGGFSKSSVVVLRRCGPDGDVYLVVEGYHFEHSSEDQSQYHYESGTCPANYFRATKEVLIRMPNGEWEVDPHGIFEYVGTFVPEEQPIDWDNISNNYDDLVDLVKRATAAKIGAKCPNCQNTLTVGLCTECGWGQ